MGDGRAERSSAIGDGGNAAVSLMPDVDGTGSGSFLAGFISIYPLVKTIQRYSVIYDEKKGKIYYPDIPGLFLQEGKIGRAHV